VAFYRPPRRGPAGNLFIYSLFICHLFLSCFTLYFNRHGHKRPFLHLVVHLEAARCSQLYPLLHASCIPYYTCSYVPSTEILSVCLSVDLSICLSVCLSAYLSVYISVYLSVDLSVYLSIDLSVCMRVCLSMYSSTCIICKVTMYKTIRSHQISSDLILSFYLHVYSRKSPRTNLSILFMHLNRSILFMHLPTNPSTGTCTEVTLYKQARYLDHKLSLHVQWNKALSTLNSQLSTLCVLLH